MATVKYSALAAASVAADADMFAINQAAGGPASKSLLFSLIRAQLGGPVSALNAAEVAITAAATATLNREHVCSGTTADYALTLPAASGNAGAVIGVRISGAMTRWLIVTGNGAELIDGLNTRKMWARESCILLCDGTGWNKIAGKAVPICVTMKRTSAQALTTVAWTLVPTTTVIADNTSALATPAGDTTNGRIRILRASKYKVAGFVSATAMTAGKLLNGGVVMDNGILATPGDPAAWGSMSAATSGIAYAAGSAAFVGDVAKFFCLTGYNEDTANRNTITTAGLLPNISVLEVPDW